MNKYEVAIETISGVKLPHIFECSRCRRICHLLEDDTSIYVEGNAIKTHECSKVNKWRNYAILVTIWLVGLAIVLVGLFIKHWLLGW